MVPVACTMLSRKGERPRDRRAQRAVARAAELPQIFVSGLRKIMRIALLIGANPRSSRVDGLAIPLRAGTWRITSTPLISSEIVVNALDGQYAVNEVFKLETKSTISVEFKTRGTELFVSLFAELVN